MTWQRRPPPNGGSGSLAALLVLADGRFPAGSHAHSGGLEAAVAAGGVRDAASLEVYLRGRLHDIGAPDAALAAASHLRVAPWAALDAEAAARCPAPALRAASRALGRSLLRAAARAWPSSELLALARTFPQGPMQPLAWGAASLAAGLDPRQAATCAATASVAGPASAAVRLLGLDPFDVAAIQGALAPQIDEVAHHAVEQARRAKALGSLRGLPAPGAPLPDLAAEDHAAWPSRLFAS